MKAYKVAKRCGDNTLVSVGDLQDQYRYTYRLDKVNRPAFKNSKFFIFKNLSLAEKFRDLKGGEIWEVEVCNVKIIFKTVKVWTPYVHLDLFKRFWAKKYVDPFKDLEGCTTGAYTCSSIDFIKKVL